jgi:GntR family transcriptional regulator
MNSSTLRRHEAVERHLRSRIAGLRPGDPVESDAELCALFNVSRMTVRQASQRLVAAGLIYRVPGIGTFVAEPQVHREAAKLRSFTEEMALLGATVESQLLTSEMRRGSSEEVAALRLPPRASVVHVRRLRRADGQPMAVEDVVLPPSCSAVLDADLERGSLHAALSALGEEPTSATGTQVAVLADEQDAVLLSVAPGAALLVERRLICNQDGVPLERTETRYVGERFVFHITLSR